MDGLYNLFGKLGAMGGMVIGILAIVIAVALCITLGMLTGDFAKMLNVYKLTLANQDKPQNVLKLLPESIQFELDCHKDVPNQVVLSRAVCVTKPYTDSLFSKTWLVALVTTLIATLFAYFIASAGIFDQTVTTPAVLSSGYTAAALVALIGGILTGASAVFQYVIRTSITKKYNDFITVLNGGHVATKQERTAAKKETDAKLEKLKAMKAAKAAEQKAAQQKTAEAKAASSAKSKKAEAVAETPQAETVAQEVVSDVVADSEPPIVESVQAFDFADSSTESNDTVQTADFSAFEPIADTPDMSATSQSNNSFVDASAQDAFTVEEQTSTPPVFEVPLQTEPVQEPIVQEPVIESSPAADAFDTVQSAPTQEPYQKLIADAEALISSGADKNTLRTCWMAIMKMRSDATLSAEAKAQLSDEFNKVAAAMKTAN